MTQTRLMIMSFYTLLKMPTEKHSEVTDLKLQLWNYPGLKDAEMPVKNF